jgi:hypothetical protein
MCLLARHEYLSSDIVFFFLFLFLMYLSFGTLKKNDLWMMCRFLCNYLVREYTICFSSIIFRAISKVMLHRYDFLAWYIFNLWTYVWLFGGRGRHQDRMFSRNGDVDCPLLNGLLVQDRMRGWNYCLAFLFGRPMLILLSYLLQRLIPFSFLHFLCPMSSVCFLSFISTNPPRL